MNRSSSSEDSNDAIRIVLSLGTPEAEVLYLRVSPEAGEEIRSLMEAEGVFAGEVLEHSADPELLIYAASVAAGIGGLKGLAAVMEAYLGRNRHKSVKLAFGEETVDVTGHSKKYSDEVIDRFLQSAHDRQAKQDAEWRRILERDGDDK